MKLGRCSLAAVLIALVIVVIAVIYTDKPVAPPLQSAVFIPTPTPVEGVKLQDQNAKIYSKQALLGKWSILAYGYTYCPDICPTTLSSLVRVHQQLQQHGELAGVNWLFYSVDPQRDTPVKKLFKLLSFAYHRSDWFE